MTHQRTPLRALSASAIALLAVLGLSVACGGSGNSVSDEDATATANRYLATTLGLFTGTTPPQQYVELFAPECREGVDVASLTMVSAFIQALAPELQGVVIEEVDAGEFDISRDGDGTLVTPKDPSAMRVKVDGAFVPASEFFANAGFDASPEDEPVEPVLLVERDGNVFLGNCQELRDLSGGLNPS